MERRRSTRTRYRLPTEIVHAGARHYGFLADVSARGAFVQTMRSLPVGTEIELWFTDDQLAPQVARARVARRRNLPAAASSPMRAGIGVEWIEAPQFARELAGDSGIDIVIDGADWEGAAAEPASAAPSADRVDVEAADGAGAGPGPAALAEPIAANTPLATDVPLEASGAAASAAATGEIVPLESTPLSEQTLELGPVAVRAEVALIDEGELGEIEALVRSLGANTLRMRWGAQADPIAWEAPPQLVIVSARVALAVPLSDTMLGAGARGIAMCDSEASTLRAQLRRQGYEFVVQRSAHPETLRLLFASLLARRPERRKQRRRAFGAAATFWRGFRRASGTLLELSSSGASLLLAGELPRGTKLSVRIPAKHAAGRALALPCQVVRSAPSAHGIKLGLRFEALSTRKRKRVDALVRELDASGPVARERAAVSAKPADHRRGPRARIALQALALDAHSHVARDVLFGTDLSLGGMRVEPHPRLARGAELELALQPPGGGLPVNLRAEVARDEGERGLVLRFVSLSTTARGALEQILEAAVEIERTRGAREAREERIVLSTLIEAEAAR